jgi:predicted DsbA family dithiol-disulfide isomerase
VVGHDRVVHPDASIDASVDVFADVVCPFTHVGLRRFMARRAQLGTEAPRLHVRAWPLELVNGAPFDPAYVAHHVDELRRQVSPELFAGFTPEAVPRTSMPAFELVAQAYTVDDATGEAVSLAVRTALFEDGLDVTDPAVLATIGDAHGVGTPGGEARARVAADFEEGQRRGVQGSPEFFLGTRGYFCPGLDIERIGDDLVIAPATERFEAFLDDCFAT